MKPATFASLVSALLYEKRFGPYFCQPVIAGLGDDGKPFISHFLKFPNFIDEGDAIQKMVIKSKEASTDCMRRILRHKVMISSGRQVVAGLLTAGAAHGVRYVASKMNKAMRSRR